MDTFDIDSLNYVSFHNPDTEFINVEYGKKIYATVHPGETKMLPLFLAEHAGKHLMDQMCNHANKSTADKLYREELRKRIFVGGDVTVTQEKKTKEQILQETIDRLNVELQAARQAAAPEPPKAPLEPAIPATMPAIAIDNCQTIAPETNGEPTREQVYSFLRNSLKMDLSVKDTMEKLDAMNVAQLVSEFNYEPPQHFTNETPEGDLSPEELAAFKRDNPDNGTPTVL